MTTLTAPKPKAGEITAACADCDGTGMAEDHDRRCRFARFGLERCTCRAQRCPPCRGRGEVTL